MLVSIICILILLIVLKILWSISGWIMEVCGAVFGFIIQLAITVILIYLLLKVL